MTKTFDFIKTLKKCLIGSACVILAGLIMIFVFGIGFDIAFVGGSRFTYSYSGDADSSAIASTIEKELGIKPVITKSSDYASNSQKLVITFSGDVTEKIDSTIIESLLSTDGTSSENVSGAEVTGSEAVENPDASSGEAAVDVSDIKETDPSKEGMVGVQKAIGTVLTKNYADNEFELKESNTVNPTLAGSFLVKALFAVLVAAVLVILYIGIRFRRIGGVSAGITAFIALIHDLIISFIVCVVFKLDIDTNFFAVILTLLGYSINNTIVIFDRVRENRKYYPNNSVRVNVNNSINQTLMRSVMTTLTTFASIVSIALVAEFFGVTALRSFAIPMAIGVLSGCYTSVFLAGPLWVKWCEYKTAHNIGTKKK